MLSPIRREISGTLAAFPAPPGKGKLPLPDIPFKSMLFVCYSVSLGGGILMTAVTWGTMHLVAIANQGWKRGDGGGGGGRWLVSMVAQVSWRLGLMLVVGKW